MPSIEQLERERGIMFENVKDPSKEISQEDFDKKIENGDKFVGVDFENREAFLRDNGYQITRKNMMDASLSVRPKDEQ